ncbi:MAG: hypothetical protein HC861_06075, partial [Rhodospirillaceae bacterium]|nr:hypothetical protein [Rhodospirillaceae bacterium]
MIGGALVGLAFVFIAALRGGATREPRPFWARSETLESLIAVFMVSMIALGFALVVSSVKSGWVPLALGLAVAIAGMIVAIVLAPRRAAAEIGAP